MIDGLLEAAGHQFWLHSTFKDSELTRYEHFQQLYEQTGDMPEELQMGSIPDIVAHIWEWFQELNAGRGDGPISYTEIKAWAELTGRRPKQFELSALKALDLQFLKHHYDGR